MMTIVYTQTVLLLALQHFTNQHTQTFWQIQYDLGGPTVNVQIYTYCTCLLIMLHLRHVPN